MLVDLVSPEQVLYSGDATMVVARGTEGEVGVLDEHIPLVISLASGVLRIVQPGGDEVRAAVYGGFLEVRGNVVTILSDDAELASEIDPEEAARTLEDLRRRVRDDATLEGELANAEVRAAVHA